MILHTQFVVIKIEPTRIKGVSGPRAPLWHAGGQEFESPWLHLVFTGALEIPRAFLLLDPGGGAPIHGRSKWVG